MDVITMAKIDSLVKKLTGAFPYLTFRVSDDFRWSPDEQTVYFCNETDETAPYSLLHETAHGLLKHTDFSRDISLLKLERDAWTYAQQELGPRFDLTISDDLIEEGLDSYRYWLHIRSLCPDCEQTGLQTDKETYLCLGCDTSWRTNDARRCGLKRYKLDKTKTPTL